MRGAITRSDRLVTAVMRHAVPMTSVEAIASSEIHQVLTDKLFTSRSPAVVDDDPIKTTSESFAGQSRQKIKMRLPS
ncbi:hypothetical protein [Bradyrhizobium sp. ORS 285]|uniref:hypothetical protein n=1 Tax=Bradyrhizobium sp. ORS 285 TaxID=115808 RepID=UPI00031354C4|nr:hypothetical protein [Bradyrhizobium sp. ORS 285]